MSNLFRSNKKLTIDQLIVKKTIISFFPVSFGGCIWAGNGCASGRWTVISAVVFTNLSVIQIRMNLFNKIFSKITSQKISCLQAVKRVRFNGNWDWVMILIPPHGNYM
jgi:hypothetical protein